MKRSSNAARRKRTGPAKLTLSVRPQYVAMLRRASAERCRSITELVEEMAARLDLPADAEEDKGHTWIERNLGVLLSKVKPADWKRNDRVGDILRKHAPKRYTYCWIATHR